MSDRRRRPRADPLDNWVPKTQLGRMVFEGQISSIYEIFEEGYRIKEVEIIDVLLPDLRDDVLDINLVQKQTDAGERSSFRAIVAVGNGPQGPERHREGDQERKAQRLPHPEGLW